MDIEKYIEQRDGLLGNIDKLQKKLNKLKAKLVGECKHEIVYHDWKFWDGSPVVCSECGFTVNGSCCGATHYWPKSMKQPKKLIEVDDIEDFVSSENRIYPGDLGLEDEYDKSRED